MPFIESSVPPLAAVENGEWKSEFYRNYQPTIRADDFPSRYPYLKRLIGRQIPADRSIRLVDLGCGTGTLLETLQRNGYRNTIGVDVSASQIALARKRGTRGIQHKDALEFLLESSAAQFDVAISLDVIEHFTRPELLEFGRHVYRVLAPGGRWLVHAPNAGAIFGSRIRYADVTHEQAFTPESLEQWGALFGFRRTQCVEDKPAVHGMKSLLRRTVWEAVRSAAAICLVAESGPPSTLILSQNLLAVFTK